jgi:hypothetical protein
MLTQHRISVSLSLLSFDLPLWSVVETDATLYQRSTDCFHLLLTEPLIVDVGSERSGNATQTPRLLWLELSPYRVMMTMQGNGRSSYRHYWEQGVYGMSRYWLQQESQPDQIQLRNFTRSLTLEGSADFPRHLRVEYELWAGKVQVGHYVMNVEIQGRCGDVLGRIAGQ